MTALKFTQKQENGKNWLNSVNVRTILMILFEKMQVYFLPLLQSLINKVWNIV